MVVVGELSDAQSLLAGIREARGAAEDRGCMFWTLLAAGVVFVAAVVLRLRWLHQRRKRDAVWGDLRARRQLMEGQLAMFKDKAKKTE